MMELPIKYEIKIENGDVKIQMSKKEIQRLFSKGFYEFDNEIDRMVKDAKNMYFRGRIEND